MSLQRVRINNISDFVPQMSSAGGNNSSEENSSTEYSGTGLRISSTERPVAKSSRQDDTDAENPHTPGMEKPFAWSAEQSSLWDSWWSLSDSSWSGEQDWHSSRIVALIISFKILTDFVRNYGTKSELLDMCWSVLEDSGVPDASREGVHVNGIWTYIVPDQFEQITVFQTSACEAVALTRGSCPWSAVAQLCAGRALSLGSQL